MQIYLERFWSMEVVALQFLALISNPRNQLYSAKPMLSGSLDWEVICLSEGFQVAFIRFIVMSVRLRNGDTLCWKVKRSLTTGLLSF